MKEPGRLPAVAIVGCKATSSKWCIDVEWMAREVGARASMLGFVVITGGHSGVMEAAARGAREAGGFVVGITTTELHRDGNRWCSIVLPSGMGIGRNNLTALGCDVMVGLPGGLGTLQEMTFAIEHARPVLSWGSWAFGLGFGPEYASRLEHVADTSESGAARVSAWLEHHRGGPTR